MRDFHEIEPGSMPRGHGFNDLKDAAVIGVGCMGMLAGGIVIGAFATATISVELYAVLILLQFIVTQGCIWRFTKQARQWLKMMGELP